MNSHNLALHEKRDVPASTSVRVLLACILAPLIAGTFVATLLLWPSERSHPSADLGPPTELIDGVIDRIDRQPCQPGADAGICRDVRVVLHGGPDRGNRIVLAMTEGPGQPTLAAGDKIIVGMNIDPSGQPAYVFVDFQREQGLAILGIAFAVLVCLVARWRGLGALAGLVITFFVVTEFMIPSILEGNSPVAVALAGGSVIVLTVLYIAHGLNARTTTAVIGTLLSMILTGALAVLGVELAHLTGMSSEETAYVQSFAGRVNIQGLLLGGMIIGALGVLNDMTVTQASTVWEIHAASPLRKRVDLYKSGMRVGRDHIASTVYTLVLAYTGAALPLLILFVLTGRGFVTVATSDIVAEEAVRTIVGSIGLILSVPITTALAALVVKAQSQPPAVDDEEPATPEPAPVDPEGSEETEIEAEQPAEVEAAVSTPEPEEPEPEPVVTPVSSAVGINKPDSGTMLFTSGEPDEPWADPKTEASIAQFLESSPPPVEGVPSPARQKRWYLPFSRYSTPVGVPRRMGRRERRFWKED